jgi:hypothetical protein
MVRAFRVISEFFDQYAIPLAFTSPAWRMT